MPVGLEAAIRLIKSGDLEGGQYLLAEILAREPDNETAWLWMAGAVDDDERRCYCLSRVLQFNPDHALAREALAQLSPPPAPGGTSPGPAPRSPPAVADTAPDALEPETAGPDGVEPEAIGLKTTGVEAAAMAVARPQRVAASGRQRLLLLSLGVVFLLAGAGLVYGGAASLAGYARDPVAYAAVAPDVLWRFALLVVGLAGLVCGAWAIWRAMRLGEEEG